MVKPSLPYLDIIADAAKVQGGHIPVACYQVSGEYAMVCAGAEKGIYGLREGAFETMEGFVRAGSFDSDCFFTPIERKQPYFPFYFSSSNRCLGLGDT